MDFREFGPAETVTIETLAGVGAIPENLRRVCRRWRFPPPFVFSVQNTDLVGPDALPIAPTGGYIIEATDGSTLRATDAIIRALSKGIAPVHRGTGTSQATVVSLAGPWSTEFFHWFTEYLPRIRVLKRYEQETGIQPQILLPNNPPEWLTRSLRLVGVSREQWISWDGGRWSIDRLVVPSIPRHTESIAPPEGYIPSPRALKWVKRQLLSGLPSTDRPDIGSRLYISRSRQSTRHVRNEADLLSVAGDYGFETVYPEEWTLDEQLAIFADADAVIGPHGAGLLNAIYGDDTTLIELFGERTNPCFFAIAEGMDMNYAMTHCETVGEDMRIVPERLRELLALALDE